MQVESTGHALPSQLSGSKTDRKNYKIKFIQKHSLLAAGHILLLHVHQAQVRIT